MMHTVVKSHRSGRDVVPKKFVDEICGVLQDADIGLRKYAIKDFRTYIPIIDRPFEALKIPINSRLFNI